MKIRNRYLYFDSKSTNTFSYSYNTFYNCVIKSAGNMSFYNHNFINCTFISSTKKEVDTAFYLCGLKNCQFKRYINSNIYFFTSTVNNNTFNVINNCQFFLRDSSILNSQIINSHKCSIRPYTGTLIKNCTGFEERILIPPLQCPETGSFTAFKKLAEDKIATLLIPEDALRSSAYNNKCRANKAVCLEIRDIDTGAYQLEGHSRWDENFIYKPGETYFISDFDTDRWHECAAGIHFFMTEKEAIDY